MNVSDALVIGCDECGRKMQLVDGIFVDSFWANISNFLENIAYDELHGVSNEGSQSIGIGYRNILKTQLGIEIGKSTRILEIGAGSGLLSLGLFMSGVDRNLVITDVSRAFIVENRRRISDYAARSGRNLGPTNPSHVLCSIDDLPFRQNSFDLIVGNSVLHHIYDYGAALKSLRDCLRDGGHIVLSEPVVQGKVLQALALKLISEIDCRAPHPKLSPSDRAKISNIGISSNSNWWRAEAERKKDTADDKHLFDVDELKRLGPMLGFSSVHTLGAGPVAANLRENIEHEARIFGLNTDCVQEYNYVLDIIKDILVEALPQTFFSNHSLIVFRK